MKVLVYGLGRMGKNHARVWSELGHDVYAYDAADISKICSDIGYEHVKDIDSGIKKVDAVSICVPNSYHLEAAKKCFDYQKHVLIEKPIAKDLDDADSIIVEYDNCGSRDLVAMVGHVENFNPAFKMLKKLVRREDHHEIESMRFKRYGPMPPSDFSCGVTLDLGIHDVDLALRLSGDMKWIRGDFLSKINFSGNDYETKSHVDIGFGYRSKEADCVASFDLSWISKAKVRIMDVTTKNKHYEVDLDAQKIGEKKKFDGKYVDYIDLRKKSVPIENIEVEPKEPLKEEILHFIECIDKGTPTNVSLHDGYNALRIIKLAESSAKQNGIKINL